MTTIEMLEKEFRKFTNVLNIYYYNDIKEELRVLEILYKHITWKGSLQYIKSMAEYWEEEHKSITQERLDIYDFPFTVDEFEIIVRWLKKKEESE